MAGQTKLAFLEEMGRRCGALRKLGGGQSLYTNQDDSVRVYIRYSRVHDGAKTFYGLRQDDLRQLEGHASLICFLWDGQEEPLLIPFSDYEEVFRTTSPASDGQYKAQVYIQDGST